jgi:hypothetical protein
MNAAILSRNGGAAASISQEHAAERAGAIYPRPEEARRLAMSVPRTGVGADSVVLDGVSGEKVAGSFLPVAASPANRGPTTSRAVDVPMRCPSPSPPRLARSGGPRSRRRHADHRVVPGFLARAWTPRLVHRLFARRSAASTSAWAAARSTASAPAAFVGADPARACAVRWNCAACTLTTADPDKTSPTRSLRGRAATVIGPGRSASRTRRRASRARSADAMTGASATMVRNDTRRRCPTCSTRACVAQYGWPARVVHRRCWFVGDPPRRAEDHLSRAEVSGSTPRPQRHPARSSPTAATVSRRRCVVHR